MKKSKLNRVKKRDSKSFFFFSYSKKLNGIFNLRMNEAKHSLLVEIGKKSCESQIFYFGVFITWRMLFREIGKLGKKRKEI
jgi:hypothetical protein